MRRSYSFKFLISRTVGRAQAVASSIAAIVECIVDFGCFAAMLCFERVAAMLCFERFAAMACRVGDVFCNAVIAAVCCSRARVCCELQCGKCSSASNAQGCDIGHAERFLGHASKIIAACCNTLGTIQSRRAWLSLLHTPRHCSPRERITAYLTSSASCCCNFSHTELSDSTKWELPKAAHSPARCESRSRPAIPYY